MTPALLVYATAARSHVHSQRLVRRTGFGRPGARPLNNDILGKRRAAMPSTYRAPEYPYVAPPEIAAGGVARTQVAIVGAGPVGLAAAIDLAQQGIDFIIVDDDDTVSVGSRAICYAKRTLEILDRLGCGEPIVRTASAGTSARCSSTTSWRTSSTCCPSPATSGRRSSTCSSTTSRRPWSTGSRRSAIELRWKNKAVGIEAGGDGAAARDRHADGRYRIEPTT